jgi:hypothetical protein
VWRDVSKAIAEHTQQFQKATAGVVKHYKIIAGQKNELKNLTPVFDKANISWSGISSHMKLGLERIRDATLMIGKWSGLTATFAGIFSLSGLWGMGQIGRTVGERRTSAMGNKVTYGEQEAFGTYFSRLGGVSLEGIREGLQDPRSEAATGIQSLLGAGGLREETARGDPAETFKRLAPIIRQKFMPQKGDAAIACCSSACAA